MMKKGNVKLILLAIRQNIPVENLGLTTSMFKPIVRPANIFYRIMTMTNKLIDLKEGR